MNLDGANHVTRNISKMILIIGQVEMTKAQLNADNWLKVIEWIPCDKFKDVKQIGKGGFGTIHYARWIDEVIIEWDIENQQWKRYRNDKDQDKDEYEYEEVEDEDEDQEDDDEVGVEVALKKFDNFVNFNDVLNEMAIHFKQTLVLMMLP
ncbi:hypothetical protein Glove_83g41 [Diversispora epigaea]|uniref:Protein kinase domain-containing protein n=1 Tax=Diversispora epigaea TaxID=1348612 RepID=A0A397JIC7_9GLOM|nr:hypothetical protein Glove_83g41 [Diversispora epigaea]